MMAAPREERVWSPAAVDLTILARLADGETVDTTARHVGLSERTVRRRLRAMADELGVDTTIEVVVYAVRERLI